MGLPDGNSPTDPIPQSATSAGAPASARSQDKEQGRLRSTEEIRILILDDDPTICQLMKTVLKAALADNQFVVEAVSNPAQMEKKLHGKPYHLIILDYVIPGFEAEQLLGWMHQYQPDASIIVVTGYPSLDSALNCLRARTYDYLTKPFQVAQLQRVVTRCLESKGLLRMSEEALLEMLGAVIRERRKALGLTLAQFAQRSNVSLGYLSQIELGRNSASIEMLYRISLGLGIKLSELFQAVQIYS